MVVDDDPCWGSPDRCSLADLLEVVLQHGGEKRILLESPDYLVLNKPNDLRMDGPFAATVHKLLSFWYPPPSLQKLPERDRLVVLSKLSQFMDLKDNELRPCHQLDYATSGVLLVARNARAANSAREAFEARTAQKKYVAVVEGHVRVTGAWPCYTSDFVEKCMRETEKCYRQGRGKRNKDTFHGYQPPSAVFQQWQMQKRRNRKGVRFSDEQWESIWSEVILNDEDTADVVDMSWRQVKHLKPQTAALFEKAAAVYNDLLRQSAISGKPLNSPLPMVFTVNEETPNSFYVYAPMAQIDADFEMRIPPDIKEQSMHCHVQAGSTDLDYKPSLTRFVIQARSHICDRHSIAHPVTKLSLEPRTGRRHQLRIHTALMGCPIVGDLTYSKRRLLDRMCLHAEHLKIALPSQTIDVVASDPFVENDGKLKIAPV